MPIAEIQFVNKSKAIVKVVAKQFGGYEIIQLQDVPLESSNLLGVPVYRHARVDYIFFVCRYR
jgi:hypothetical protein